MAVKFHNVYDYTIERHPLQVSENHKPLVHPSHEGNWVVRWVPHETQDWAIVAHKLAPKLQYDCSFKMVFTLTSVSCKILSSLSLKSSNSFEKNVISSCCCWSPESLLFLSCHIPSKQENEGESFFKLEILDDRIVIVPSAHLPPPAKSPF